MANEHRSKQFKLRLIEGGVSQPIELKREKPCPYQSGCPMTQAAGEEAPIAGVYVLITDEGVINGAHKIKPHHLNDVILALDRLKANLEEKEREWGL